MKKSSVKSPRNEVFTVVFISGFLALFLNIFLRTVDFSYIARFIFPGLLLLIGYLVIVFYLKYEINPKAFYLLIPIFLIECSDLIIPIAISNALLNLIMLFILIPMFFVIALNKDRYISREVFKWPWILTFANFIKNCKIIQVFKTGKKVDATKLPKILLGCLIGIPIAFFILDLLMSADRYFESFLESFLVNFHDIDFLDSVVSFVISTVVSFFLIYNVYANSIRLRGVIQKTTTRREVDAIIARTVLVILNFVFVLFLFSEISKLTVNFLKVPTLYTHASYAREGFFQLLFVTLINFSIILYLVYSTDIVDKDRIVKRLLYLLIFFSILLIFNSYYRMYLYIYEYGFTILRLQVILFLLMELILFGLVIKKMHSSLKRNDGTIFTTVMLITYLLNLYLCINPVVNLLNRLLH